MWELDSDLDIPEDNNNTLKENNKDKIGPANEVILDYIPNDDILVNKSLNSLLAGDHVVCGRFETALNLLKKQIGAYNWAPFKNVFLNVHLNSSLYLSNVPFAKPLEFRIHNGLDNRRFFFF